MNTHDFNVKAEEIKAILMRQTGIQDDTLYNFVSENISPEGHNLARFLHDTALWSYPTQVGRVPAPLYKLLAMRLQVNLVLRARLRALLNELDGWKQPEEPHG